MIFELGGLIYHNTQDSRGRHHLSLHKGEAFCVSRKRDSPDFVIAFNRNTLTFEKMNINHFVCLFYLLISQGPCTGKTLASVRVKMLCTISVL